MTSKQMLERGLRKYADQNSAASQLAAQRVAQIKGDRAAAMSRQGLNANNPADRAKFKGGITGPLPPAAPVQRRPLDGLMPTNLQPQPRPAAPAAPVQRRPLDGLMPTNLQPQPRPAASGTFQQGQLTQSAPAVPNQQPTQPQPAQQTATPPPAAATALPQQQTVARPAPDPSQAPPPESPPLERQQPTAETPNQPVNIAADAGRKADSGPGYNATPRFQNSPAAYKALENPNLPLKDRQLAVQTILDDVDLKISHEDRATLQRIGAGENDEQTRAFTAQGFNRFKQEQIDQAPPKVKQDPQAFGNFMGQVQGMWDGLGPYGQMAAMIGIPAGIIGLLGSDGLSMILGGLGVGALGMGAGAMGMMGEGMQANMGRMLGDMGNFFGVIPDEARNADLLVNGGNAAKQRVQQAMAGAESGKGLEAGQAALAAERAKFEPLLQLHSANPDLAYSYLMGMHGDAARPKTRAEAEALYNNLNSQYQATGQDGYLQQQVYDAATQRAAPLNALMPDLAQAGAAMAAPYLPESLQGYARAVANPSAAAGRYFGNRAMYGSGSAPRVKGSAAKAIWRRHFLKQALSAIDQKELLDLKAEQRHTQPQDPQKQKRVQELLGRQPKPEPELIKICMKAARCWAGYEPVPGAKAYSRGSCRPVGSKKTQKDMKSGTERPDDKAKQQSRAKSSAQVPYPTAQGTRARTATC